MAEINAGRFTAELDQPFVVFLVGMRVTRFLAFRKCLQVPTPFVIMLNGLRAHPESGFLHGEQFFRLWPLTTIMVSYWRSFEDLERFARSKDVPHLAAWQRFVRSVGGDSSVGLWHETYAVEPGKYEVVHVNMPIFGLAGAAGKSTPVSGHRDRARGRMTGQEEAASAEPVYAEQ